VCIKNPGKKRNAPAGLFTTDKDLLLYDPNINVIVEVISDSDQAFEIVSTALKNDKDVVSASKKMIAEHLPELLQIQGFTRRSLLYEAAAGASIPIIRNLEEYYDNDLLHSMQAIVNGSTNFVLTRMFEENMDFREALLLAQQLGFAEADPALDVEGHDAANKWRFLLTHAYGIIPGENELIFTGIQNITKADAAMAREKNCAIKLVAQAHKLPNGKVAAFVLPSWVRADDHLAFVKNEYNGVVVESGFADRQFFYGKGAGSFPTASAILSDISALRYGYRYEYKKLYHHKPLELTDDFYIRARISFQDWDQVPRAELCWVEEWHGGPERKSMVAGLHFSSLDSDWWKQSGVSFILTPEPFVDEAEIEKMVRTSMEPVELTQLEKTAMTPE
jgi:homoserine dehydrogenase